MFLEMYKMTFTHRAQTLLYIGIGVGSLQSMVNWLFLSTAIKQLVAFDMQQV